MQGLTFSRLTNACTHGKLKGWVILLPNAHTSHALLKCAHFVHARELGFARLQLLIHDEVRLGEIAKLFHYR